MGSGGLDPRLEIQSPCALRFLALHWVAMPPSEDVEAVGIVASALRHLFPRLGPIWAARKATLGIVGIFNIGIRHSRPDSPIPVV